MCTEIHIPNLSASQIPAYVLIDVAPDARFSLIDLVSVKDFLEDRLGRRVDVVTKEGLDPAVRDRVLREAEAVF